MHLADMRAKVRAELAHIPDWPAPQRELRMVYWSMRMASLGRKRQVVGTALDVVRQSIESLKDRHPDHTFQYDEAYFRSASETN
jgi:hypothetical protein